MILASFSISFSLECYTWNLQFCHLGFCVRTTLIYQPKASKRNVLATDCNCKNVTLLQQHCSLNYINDSGAVSIILSLFCNFQFYQSSLLLLQNRNKKLLMVYNAGEELPMIAGRMKCREVKLFKMFSRLN